MWGSRGLERVLCRVIDQDLCVDLLADLARKSLGLVVLIFSLGTHIGFGQLGDKLMPIRKCGFLGLPGADYRLKYTWMMTRCNDTILSRRGSPTREVTIHPEETTFPFLNSPSGYHDKLKAHFFEPSVRGLKASAPSVLNNGAETTLGSLAKNRPFPFGELRGPGP